MSQNSTVEKWFTVGDRRVSIADTLVDAAGAAIDLTGCSVAFLLVNAISNAVKVSNAAATIDDAALGQVSYAWQAADVDTAGYYYAWWVVTQAGKAEHFPGDGRRYKVRFVAAA